MVSFIIPTYNDTEHIAEITLTIDNISVDHEIIVVDDGSKKEHKQVLESLPNVRLISHEINKGKTSAMKTGFTESFGEIIVFVDADLINLTTADVEKLIIPVVNDDYDITMSKKTTGIKKYIDSGYPENFTGERVFKRKIIEENLDIFTRAKNYTIESEMNRRFYGKYRIAIVHWPNVSNPMKARHGIKAGISADIKMQKEILTYLSKKELLNQLRFVRKLPLIE